MRLRPLIVVLRQPAAQASLPAVLPQASCRRHRSEVLRGSGALRCSGPVALWLVCAPACACALEALHTGLLCGHLLPEELLPAVPSEELLLALAVFDALRRSGLLRRSDVLRRSGPCPLRRAPGCACALKGCARPAC